jgi:hypothetical protein
MNPRIVFGVATLASGTLCLAAPSLNDAPTFSKDVAPIVLRRCAPCHQPDGDAPFPLLTYDDVRRHARQIADVTSKRFMPPWKPAPDSPPFVGDRRLTEAEIAIFARWASAGALEGTPRRTAADAPRRQGWLGGEPDLVLTLPTYALRADGLDVFRNFVVTVPGVDRHWVRGFQLRPGSRAVHHACAQQVASNRLRHA